MITDLLLYILGIFVNSIAFILSSLNFLVPSQFQTAIEQYFGYFAYAQGILPIVPNPAMSGLAHDVGLLTIVGWGVSFIGVWYTLKLALWVFHLVPWLGKHVSLPHGGSGETAKQKQ